jgi:signal transduction histidine kinase
LADLIEKLLDVSRIATGRLTLTLEPFDLVEAVRDALDRMRDAADAARCTLSISNGAPISGRWDRLRIEQIVTNLLSNAIRHAAGTPIDIAVRMENGEAVIEVRDHGEGISEEDLPRIFQRFERANRSSPGGLGLGLYIARQIAEAHGGSVSAHNVPGGGASFMVRLPIRA